MTLATQMIMAAAAGNPTDSLPLAAVGGSSTPNIGVYSVNSDTSTFKRRGTPPGTGSVNALAFSPSGDIMAAALAVSPFTAFYARRDADFARRPNPATLLVANTGAVCISPDDVHYVFLNATSPYVHVYKKTGVGINSSFEKLPALPAAGGSANGCAFSRDGNILAVAHTTSPYCTIYSRSGDTFTVVTGALDVLPPGAGNAVSFDPTADRMWLAHTSTPFSSVYTYSGTAFTKQAAVTAGPGNGTSCAMTSDGVYIAVGHSAAPYFSWYKNVSGTITKLTNPTVTPTATASTNNVAWSKDGKFLLSAAGGAATSVMFERSGDTLTQIALPSVISGTALAAAFWAGPLSPIGPGPQTLVGSNATCGFYGEYALITPDGLESSIESGGMTAGTAMNRSSTFLKFKLDGKTLFVSKLPLRRSISWQTLYQYGIVYGDNTNGVTPAGGNKLQDKRITINGYTFIIRLLKCVTTDPALSSTTNDAAVTHGSEWNRLMYNISTATDKASQVGVNWANYSDADLGLTTATQGHYSWCQDTTSDQAGRFIRGNTVTGTSYGFTNTAYATVGWRPCLELVPPT